MSASAPAAPPDRRARLRHQAEILRVIAGAEFKLKYADSALGYVWSVVKPLSFFAVLWVVFGRFFKLGAVFDQYPLYLITGLVLWTFFADATGLTMYSLVSRASLLRKLAFPRLVVPISSTLVAVITLLINLTVVGVFVAYSRITPRLEWLLLPPLLLELYVVTLAIGVALAALYVRFRDVGQVWELLAQLLFYASPVIYPLGLLPGWARSVALLNPVTQVMQDVRVVIIPDAPPNSIPTPPDVLGPFGHVYPLLVAAGIVVAAYAIFRHEEPWLAERT